MPQIQYRVNLAAASVPFAGPDIMGQSVIVPGQDHTFSRQLAARADQDRSVGIPQVYYIRNVMPVDSGFAAARSTVSYTAFPQGIAGQAMLPFLKNPSTGDVARVYFITPNGVVSPELGGVPISGTTSLTVSAYTVNGISYFYRAGFGGEVYRIDVATVVPVAVTGLPAPVSSGAYSDFSAVFGYHIAIDRDTFYWSSLTNPLDFTPSLATGAGNFKIQQAQGDLRAIIPAATGVYVITVGNIVFLRYTGNPRFPFAAQAVEGAAPLAGGKASISDPFLPTDEKWYLSANGIFRLTPRGATAEFGELTQWHNTVRLAGDDGQITVTNRASANFSVREACVGIYHVFVACDNYICFKYNRSSGSISIDRPAMWVFDRRLQRWGHLDNWDLWYQTPDTTYLPASSLGRLYRGGQGAANFDVAAPFEESRTPGGVLNYSGTLVMGKYQYIRARMLELQSIDYRGATEIYALASLDGKEITGIYDPTTVVTTGSNQRRAWFNGPQGMNISLMVNGSFNLNYAVLNFTVTGKFDFL